MFLCIKESFLFSFKQTLITHEHETKCPKVLGLGFLSFFFFNFSKLMSTHVLNFCSHASVGGGAGRAAREFNELVRGQPTHRRRPDARYSPPRLSGTGKGCPRGSAHPSISAELSRVRCDRRICMEPPGDINPGHRLRASTSDTCPLKPAPLLSSSVTERASARTTVSNFVSRGLLTSNPLADEESTQQAHVREADTPRLYFSHFIFIWRAKSCKV